MSSYGEYPVHALASIRADKKRGKCCQCGHVDLIWRRNRGRITYLCAPGEREKRRRNARGTHGLTRGEAKVFKENASCAICGSTRNLMIDHCHRTGVIRGVLCTKHNVGLGAFDDSAEVLRRALDYLERVSL